MPVAKLLGNSTPGTMKAEEGSDSLDTFIRQAVGTEPFFSFSRTGDSPVQWIQLLHALDQPDVPGWPLLAPMKVQMQKCDKCAREFCSSINHRRHMRVHRRSLNVHKDPQKYRDLLGAFWDKLSDDEAKEIMSFKDVNLEEVPGYSIVKNVQANLRKPIFLSLPQAYVKAGSILVEIIQGRPSRLPISSPELFSILDDASERTFLCAGTAESLQKYVFDGEAGKIGLEMKNLIACTSFLVEQKLVKAWVADKDAEALRCQKLLVEEEEAAQRRQAEQLERKRQRKLRQKEQRVKDQLNGVKVDSYATSDISETTPPTETSSPDSPIPDEQFPAPLEPLQLPNNEENINIEAQGGFIGDLSDSATDWKENDSQHFVTQWQVPKSQKSVRNNFHGNHNVKALKREQAIVHKEQRAGLTNGGKVWTKKPKPENGEAEFVKSRVQNDATNQTDQSNCQLMIGSISVTVKSSQHHNKVDNGAEIQESGTNYPTLMFWKHRRGQLAADRGGGQVLEEEATSEKSVGQTLPPENCHESRDLNGNESEDTNGSNPPAENAAKRDGMLVSVGTAKAFLIQRWNLESSRDPTKLALSSSSPEPPGQPDAQNNHRPSKSHDRTILGNAENRLGNVGTLENLKAKLRTKPEKGVKTKYIPKQRAVN